MFRFEPPNWEQREINAYADRYWTYSEEHPQTRQTEEDIVGRIAPEARRRGWFERDEFLKICRWKSQRPEKHYQKNTEADVRERTSQSFSTSSEMERVDYLVQLHGVQLPVASVLLHFGHKEPYTILDVYALKALGWDQSYPTGRARGHEFWMTYVDCRRQLADKYRVEMRILDRALWTLGKELSQKTNLLIPKEAKWHKLMTL